MQYTYDLASLNDILATIDGYIGGSSWFVFALLGSDFHGLFEVPQIRFFKHAIDVVRGKFDEEGAKGDTSHFQSLATALSGTVGTGTSPVWPLRSTSVVRRHFSGCCDSGLRYDYQIWR